MTVEHPGFSSRKSSGNIKLHDRKKYSLISNGKLTFLHNSEPRVKISLLSSILIHKKPAELNKLRVNFPHRWRVS